MNSDIAVVGAGPAGALAALLLARSGARVTMFDPSHPREKPCGGGVTARARAHIGDAVDLSDLPAVAVRAARFVDTRRGISVEVGLGHAGRPTLIVASRREFDQRILRAAERAGATLVRARVVDVRSSAARFSVMTSDRTEWRADVVLGADGANSLVRRRLARPFRRDQLSIATGFFAHGATSDEVLVELTTDPPGYLWSFPRPDHLAVGMCAQATAGTLPEALSRRCTAWMRQTHTGASARLERYAWPIPTLSSTDLLGLEVAGPGWLLIGDAAGLVDPITREGIAFGLQSAVLAAGALTSGTARPDREYQGQVRATIVPDLARAARLKAGFFQPRFASLLMRALADSTAVRQVLADLVAGEQGYGSLHWRLLRTFELGLLSRLVLGAGQ